MRSRERWSERLDMIRHQLRGRDITSPRVLAAMRRVPRHAFVPPDRAAEAYADCPLPVGHGQTISQPYIVALIAQAAALRRGCRVLDVGGGTGYQAAVLAQLAGVVWSVERIAALAADARRRCRDLGYRNVLVLATDGTRGYPPGAPYDAITVAAATRHPPPALLRQLAPGGRLVVPLGPPDLQQLTVIERHAGGDRRWEVCACCFVPLVASSAAAP